MLGSVARFVRACELMDRKEMIKRLKENERF